MIKWALRIAALFAILIALFVVWVFSPSGQIDTCLDSGGRWNHEAKACDGARD